MNFDYIISTVACVLALEFLMRNSIRGGISNVVSGYREVFKVIASNQIDAVKQRMVIRVSWAIARESLKVFLVIAVAALIYFGLGLIRSSYLDFSVSAEGVVYSFLVGSGYYIVRHIF